MVVIEIVFLQLIHAPQVHICFHPISIVMMVSLQNGTRHLTYTNARIGVMKTVTATTFCINMSLVIIIAPYSVRVSLAIATQVETLLLLVK